MTIRIALIGVLLVMMGLLAGCGGVDLAATVFAPTPVQAPGTPVSNEVSLAITPEAQMAGVIRNEGEEHRYTFVGTAGEAVTINMEAASDALLDAYLDLLAPDGTVLTSDDDGGADRNSRIENYVLPADGEYTIVAYGFSRTSTGGYSLQMAIGTPLPTQTPTPTAEPGGGPIMVGQTLPGAINAMDQVDEWFLDVAGSEYVTIEIRSTGGAYLDPRVELVDPSGSVQRVDSGGNSAYSASIENFRIPVRGTYGIRVSGSSRTVGSYDIQVIPGMPPTATPLPPTPGPSPTPFEQNAYVGQRIESVVRPNSGGDAWMLQLDEPTVIELIIQAEDDATHLYVELTKPVSGVDELVSYGEASPVIYLPSVFLRMSGQYEIRVFAREYNLVPYTMVINRLEDVGNRSGQLAYNQGISGQLQYPSQEDTWTFQGRQGDKVTVMLLGGEGLDSYVELLSSTGRILASNDDARGGGTHSLIEDISLEEDGTYTVVVGSYQGRSMGPYRLMLFRAGDSD